MGQGRGLPLRDNKEGRGAGGYTAQLGPKRKEADLFYSRLLILVIFIEAHVPMVLAQFGSEVSDYPAAMDAAVAPGHRRHHGRPRMSAVNCALMLQQKSMSPRHIHGTLLPYADHSRRRPPLSDGLSCGHGSVCTKSRPRRASAGSVPRTSN
jgi:hypothetical protein